MLSLNKVSEQATKPHPPRPIPLCGTRYAILFKYIFRHLQCILNIGPLWLSQDVADLLGHQWQSPTYFRLGHSV